MIGKNIRAIRKQQRLTLSELAERAGIAKSYLSNIERNINQNPSIQVLEKIADVLKVDIHALIDTETETETEKEEKPEEEWMDFIKELQDSGIEKEDLKEYKTVIEFIKWQNQINKKADEKGEIKNGK